MVCPQKKLGYSQAVRHRTLTPALPWFESRYPSHLKIISVYYSELSIHKSVFGFCTQESKTLLILSVFFILETMVVVYPSSDELYQKRRSRTSP